MGFYVDSFVSPVPKRKVKEYLVLAKKIGKMMRKYGALEYHECQADDVKPGKWTSFPQSVKLKSGEVVFVSWIVYKSRAHRDSVIKKMMKDPFMATYDPKTAPFDGKRMIFGGFKSVVAM